MSLLLACVRVSSPRRKRLVEMRASVALFAVALSGLGVGACGGTGGGTRTASPETSGVRIARLAGDGLPGGVEVPISHYPGGLRGDEDDDEERINFTTGKKEDNDADFDNDSAELIPKGHYDEDDTSVRLYGHAASAGEGPALTAIVKRYYAAAAAADGVAACSLITPVLVRAIPEDYGKPPGLPYMRGKTCAVVMTHLFMHSHRRLAGRIRVTGVRVQGDRAYVLIGSHTAPAVYVNVERVGGVWRIAGLLGSSLP